MSRDYDRLCRNCNVSHARSNFITADIELIQCLEKDCGTCYAEIHNFKELKTKGISEEVWKKATAEILKLFASQEQGEKT